MSPTTTSAHSDLTSDAELAFAASLAANVLDGAPLATERLHSDFERQWYRITTKAGQSFILVVAGTNPDLRWMETVSREYDLSSAPRNQIRPSSTRFTRVQARSSDLE